MHKLWNQADSKNTSAVDTYGAEHLSRLLGTPPFPLIFFTATNHTQSPCPNSSPKQTWTSSPSTAYAKSS